MDCVYIEKLRFPTPAFAAKYLEQCQNQEQDHIWQGMVFKRTQVQDVVMEYHFVDAPLNWIEKMFADQMKAKDALFAMPGTKRLGSNALGGGTTSAVGMLDNDDQPCEND